MRPSSTYITILLSISLFLSQPLPTTAFHPNWLTRTAARETLENICRCDCCYTVGTDGRSECIPPIDTSFEVSTCTKCSVESCSTAFPVACAQASSAVDSACVTRKGWVLRLVPFTFIVLSALLLLYGFFFKRFDGYHDDRSASTPIVNNTRRHQYTTFSNSAFGSLPPPRPPPSLVDSRRQTALSRSSANLPPILESRVLDALEPSASQSTTSGLPPVLNTPPLGLASTTQSVSDAPKPDAVADSHLTTLERASTDNTGTNSSAISGQDMPAPASSTEQGPLSPTVRFSLPDKVTNGEDFASIDGLD